jgi:hypothetical protein
MDFSDFGAPLGGNHQHHYFPETGERLRYIKTAAQANAKWVNSTATGQETWAANLQSTQKPIVAAAVASRSKMQSNFATATAPGGLWERRLEAVGDAGIKAAAQLKKGNYATGVSQASAKQLTAITKILAYEQAGLAQLAPKSGAGSGRTRMNEWFDYMSAGRGTLGA